MSRADRFRLMFGQPPLLKIDYFFRFENSKGECAFDIRHVSAWRCEDGPRYRVFLKDGTSYLLTFSGFKDFKTRFEALPETLL